MGPPFYNQLGGFKNIKITAVSGDEMATLPAFDIKVVFRDDDPQISIVPKLSAYAGVEFRYDLDVKTLSERNQNHTFASELPIWMRPYQLNEFFKSDDGQIKYRRDSSANTMPSWLRLDGDQWYISGKPLLSDVGVHEGIELTFRFRADSGPGIDKMYFSPVSVFTIEVFDDPTKQPPSLTLRGEELKGDTSRDLTHADYSDGSFTISAEDPQDGGITDKIIKTGSVDRNIPWLYPVTYSVTDSDGNVSTATFKVRVMASDYSDVPTISDVANQATNEDTATSVLAVTLGDAETAVADLTLSASSSAQGLVPDANIVLGGSGASRTVTVTPASNQSGSATITLTVSDGTASSTDTFVLTVDAVNDVPTISDVANQQSNEDTATGELAVTLGDEETAVADLTLSASSSTQGLVPDANIVLGGGGASRTVTVTPASNQNGSATITLTVSDGTASSTDTFVLTVGGVNDVPTISDVANQATNEDTATGELAVTLGDEETAVADLTLSAISSAQGLVPDANIVLGGSGASRTVTVTPVSNQNGSATITLTVSDGTASSTDTFVLTVDAVNDAPTISDVSSLSTNDDTATSALAVTLGDEETTVVDLTLSASSSNTVLVPDANIVLGGSGASRTVTVTPASNQSGSATITLTVSDGTASSTDTFVLTVNDVPTVSAVDSVAPVITLTGSASVSLEVGTPGSILIREFHDISGEEIADLTGNAKYPNSPDLETTAPYFEWPQSGDINVNPEGDVRDNYGLQAVGFIYPPQTANYTFYVAADNNSQVWLSTDSSPSNVVQIAKETGWQPVRGYQASGEQVSAPIALEAGKPYYINVLMKEKGGGDNMALAWAIDDTAAPAAGANPIEGQYLAPFAAYIDAGATASDNVDGDITGSVSLSGTVDVTTAGSYTLTYAVSDAAGNAATAVTRTVTVVNTTAPVLTLLGASSVSLEAGATYADAGATSDGGETVTTTGIVDPNTVGVYTLTYSASDAGGNAATSVTRTVTVSDTVAPVITLTGLASVTHELGTTYTDAGATSDGGETVTTSGTVDVNTAGTYTLTYSASDVVGNVATSVTRTVTVAADSSGSTDSGFTTTTEEAFGDVVIYANNSATLIGQVAIEGEVAGIGDVVAIYVGSELRGKHEVIISGGAAWVNAQVNAKGGEETISFKVYDSSTGVTHEKSSSSAVITPGSSVGTYASPLMIEMKDSETQTLSLNAGWNLVSFYVEATDMTAATVLAPISSSLLQIKNLTSSYDPSIPSFLNTLSSLSVKDGYWVKVSEDVSLDVEGTVPSGASISVKSGWNLVGYPEVERRGCRR